MSYQLKLSDKISHRENLLMVHIELCTRIIIYRTPWHNHCRLLFLRMRVDGCVRFQLYLLCKLMRWVQIFAAFKLNATSGLTKSQILNPIRIAKRKQNKSVSNRCESISI